MSACKTVIFGYKRGVEKALTSKIRHALDSYRELLTDIMIYIEEMTEKMNTSDKRLNGKFMDIHIDMIRQLNSIPFLWEQNQRVLEKLLLSDARFTYGLRQIPSDPILHAVPDDKIVPYCENDLQQLLVHLNRDWGRDGSRVREAIYKEGILKLVLKYRPTNKGKKLLIPGAGLGRLGFELSNLGYDVELNEVSDIMVIAMNSILNYIIPDGSTFEFFPNTQLRFSDNWSLQRRLTPSTFPFLELSSYCQSHSLTIQHGDFVSIYSDLSREKFDYVITSFFLDTASDTLHYIATIGNILSAGGLWLNVGPLHYHDNSTVPYSFDYLLRIVERSGFVLIEQRTIRSSYYGEEEFTMKPEYYEVPLTIWRLVDSGSVISIQSYVSGGAQNSVEEQEETKSHKFVLKK